MYPLVVKKLLKLREEARNLFIPCTNWSLIKGKWLWDQIRVRAAKVTWHRIIWFPAHIPKFSLIAWMATLDRLPTRDRLIRFGLVLDHGCVLCGSGIESRDHLFADCFFAQEVWDAVLVSCGIRLVSLNWDDCLQWLIVNLKGKSLRVRILKLGWTGFLYYIWEERNHRSFRGVSRSADMIVSSIKDAVKIKLYSYSLQEIDDANRQVGINWGLI
ncbi:uncharacterized protein LOC120128599 [Hibiscus syriacus]|uniref:uncharacterized protein LOC120128599 n=1 Tax=Hibiscus syriacus TaxID=106335 RepID=UPI00192293D9|nr:uncharacterized protein LOC120128599 [Hibiscus syriacus]